MFTPQTLTSLFSILLTTNYFHPQMDSFWMKIKMNTLGKVLLKIRSTAQVMVYSHSI